MNWPVVASYVNMILSLIGTVLYCRSAIRSKIYFLKVHKAMTAMNLFIIAVIYFHFINNVSVDPMVVRLNTTLIIILIISNAILGRSKYDYWK